jgi:hypothetical protein
MKHKCADCGYLAVRNIYSRELQEPEKSYRDCGMQPITLTHKMEDGKLAIISPYEPIPICFMQSKDLQTECNVLKIKSTLQTEWECDDFTEWHQGFTPKEHREMLDRKLELRRLEAQENRHNREEWARYIFLGIVTILAALIATKVI